MSKEYIWVFRVEVQSTSGGPNPLKIKEVYAIAETKEIAREKIRKCYHNTHGIIKSFVEKIYPV